MARKTAGKPVTSNAWQWGRTAETQRVLLQAAREVFSEQGFAEANVADIVERAGSSVGSLYHHFGGKTELFLALWEEHQGAHERNAISAVAKARSAGEEDSLELFIVGARAYLQGSWQRRDLARLFMNGDGPPGFEQIRRTRGREWIRQNNVLLRTSNTAVNRFTVSVLTTLIGEAGREIAMSPSKREANKITEAAVRYIRRLDPLHPEVE
ncbi:TetR/AcrR family transcriptional regulator [Qaidamihabitans albus]|uniref:TetR/AcrR family transcriptional regulator n=1 Tax=Qaidamihabitans albus TaxID=2795733 RepID=UPI0018F1FBA2|nr:TetR/AcrR family transcriptional regulator [Qaidamihabitans albus]